MARRRTQGSRPIARVTVNRVGTVHVSLVHLRSGRERQHEGNCTVIGALSRGIIVRDWDMIWPTGLLVTIVIVVIINAVTRVVD